MSEEAYELCFIDAKKRDCFVGFSFSTAPTSDNGLPHITEHCVLRRTNIGNYGDLPTYLHKSGIADAFNGLVFPDKTVFYANVGRLRAVPEVVRAFLGFLFCPAFDRNDFEEERGFADRSTARIRIGGVIPNEIAGKQASLERELRNATYQMNFMNSIYNYSFGGELEDVVNTSYEEMVDYHKEYYHINNLRMLIFGPADQEHLISEINGFLSDNDIEEKSPINLPEPQLRQPGNSTELSVLSTMNREYGIIALTGPRVTDPDGLFRMEVLTEWLIGGQRSPLRKRVNESLGRDIHPLSGIETELFYSVFSIVWETSSIEAFQTEAKVVSDLIASVDEKSLDESILKTNEESHRILRKKCFRKFRLCPKRVQKDASGMELGTIAGGNADSEERITRWVGARSC